MVVLGGLEGAKRRLPEPLLMALSLVERDDEEEDKDEEDDEADLMGETVTVTEASGLGSPCFAGLFREGMVTGLE